MALKPRTVEVRRRAQHQMDLAGNRRRLEELVGDRRLPAVLADSCRRRVDPQVADRLVEARPAVLVAVREDHKLRRVMEPPQVR